MTESSVIHLSEEQIFEYLHALSGHDECEKVKLHLHVCSECRQALESEKRLEATLMSQPHELVSRDFTKAVMHRVSEHAPKERSPQVWYWLAATMAIAFTALITPGSSTPGRVSIILHQVSNAIGPIADVVNSSQSHIALTFGLVGYLLWGLDQWMKRWFKAAR